MTPASRIGPSAENVSVLPPLFSGPGKLKLPLRLVMVVGLLKLESIAQTLLPMLSKPARSVSAPPVSWKPPLLIATGPATVRKSFKFVCRFTPANISGVPSTGAVPFQLAAEDQRLSGPLPVQI